MSEKHDDKNNINSGYVNNLNMDAIEKKEDDVIEIDLLQLAIRISF